MLDDVSINKGGFTNRNRIKTLNGPIWITIPLVRNNKIIKNIKIQNTFWIKKHLKSLHYNYSNASFFDVIMPSFKQVLLSKPWDSLVELNMSLLNYLLGLLDIEVEISFSSRFDKSSKGSQKLVDLVNCVGGSRYLAGPGSKDYLDESTFRASSIEVIQQNFLDKPYEQMYGSYESNLSILDSLFNVGPDGVKKLIK